MALGVLTVSAALCLGCRGIGSLRRFRRAPRRGGPSAARAFRVSTAAASRSSCLRSHDLGSSIDGHSMILGIHNVFAMFSRRLLFEL